MKTFLPLSFALCSAMVVSCASSQTPLVSAGDSAVLRAIEAMPKGGGYSVQPKAFDRLIASIQAQGNGGVAVHPQEAKPSFCSSATYLVLLEMVEAALKRGEFRLSKEEAQALSVYQDQKDGHGVWGRWNANGPGAAKLIKDLGLGYSFESYSHARPGDFMKIFWTEEIGKKEHGHLVVYLGSEYQGGEAHVRFWSSNKPSGYGIKTVPKSEIKWAIFSRITRLENIKRAENLPAVDSYLERMLEQRFTRASVRRKCALRP